MYSNYLLSPNFEETNVSALGWKKKKKKLFSIYFEDFKCSAGSLLREGVLGVSVIV